MNPNIDNSTPASEEENKTVVTNDSVSAPDPDEASTDGANDTPAVSSTAVPSSDEEPANVPEDSDPPTPIVTSQTSTSPSAKPNKRKYSLAALLVVLVLLVAGGVAAYLVHKHHEKVVAAQAKIVQHITLGIEGGDLGPTLYPNNPLADAGSVLLDSQVFDGLVQYENQNQIVPDLASGWTTPNDTTWIFTIKNGIKFHDGHILTPADVVYSLNLLKSMNSTNDFAESYANSLASVQAVGTNQVKIVTSQPDPVLLNKLTYLYILDKNLPKGDNPSLAGTGAYEYKPGTMLSNSKVQLVAANDFHDGQVMTKSLTMDDVTSDSQLLDGFKNHQYDIVGQVPNKDAKQPGSYTFVEHDDSVDFLLLNTTTGPLSNKLVREALRYALNPAALAEQGLGETVIPINQLIPPSIPGYNPNLPTYQQNIVKAKQLLAQAGYGNGLTLTLDISSNDLNQVISNQLKQVGITVNYKQYDNLNDLVNGFLNGQNEITSLAYASSTLDGADVLGSTIVPANYSNPKFYALVNQATTTINPAARLKLLQQAETIVSQDVPAIPLYYDDNVYLMNQPYVLHQDLSGLYTSVYFYKVHL
jgi:peptide/nickel transport system substrate-binding protein